MKEANETFKHEDDRLRYTGSKSLEERILKGRNNGDISKETFRAFADHYGPRFHAFFIRKGIPDSAAEDLAASTVTDVLRSLDKYSEGNFDGWVWRIARNKMNDWWREKEEREQSLGEFVSLSDDYLADAASFEAWNQEHDKERGEVFVPVLVKKALDAVSEKGREIIVRRNLDIPYNYKEIEKELGIKESTARSIHKREWPKFKEALIALCEQGDLAEAYTEQGER